MADFALQGTARTVVGKKVKQIRNKGQVPATIYGPKTDPVNVQFEYRPLQVALMQAGGTNLIDITVGGTTYPSLAREVQRDVLKGDILHVDFIAVDLNAKISADIPVHFNGQSPVVASRSGVLLTGPNSITVEMLASKLINRIEVDLSELKEIGDTITVGDLKLGEDVTVLNDPDEMIAKVVQTSASRAALLEAMEGEGEESEEGSAEPEVISRGGDEDEE